MAEVANPRVYPLPTEWQDPQPEGLLKFPLWMPLLRGVFRLSSWLAPRLTARWAYALYTRPRKRARHQQTDALLERARLFECLFGRRILKGYAWGTGERTVLLVHGWESRGTALRTFVAPLLKAGYQVVAFDGPAHGDTRGTATTLPEFAGAVRAMLHQVGNVEAVITHSFGGPSTIFALRHLQPEYTPSKLVMVAAPNRAEAVLKRAASTLRLGRRALDALRQKAARSAKMPLEAADVSTAPPPEDLSRILLVHDELDPIVPIDDAKETLHNWPAARLVTTRGYGHYRLMKNPDLIRYVTEFLRHD
jgi:pimeloyl-ACP methyl ester carboxylesterase